MSYARMDDQFARRGAQVVGISVDPPAHNRAMVEKLRLPFPLLSDPQGALSRCYGVWNDDQRLAIPAIVVVDRVGTVRWVYAGHDFADRPGDEDLFAALDDLGTGGEPRPAGEPERRVTATDAIHSVRPDRPAITLEQLGPYYRGAFFATVALKGRFAARGADGRAAVTEVGQYQRMVTEFSEAIAQTATMRAG
ncbi:MAG: peroxiredoxin family protein [Chloroflexi bacterium]|nr:peroxiredoxin family protein [Chloroflexota bacterium]